MCYYMHDGDELSRTAASMHANREHHSTNIAAPEASFPPSFIRGAGGLLLLIQEPEAAKRKNSLFSLPIHSLITVVLYQSRQTDILH